MIKTIIFDLDDTLYNERDFVYGAFSRVCEYLSKKFNKDYNSLFGDTIDILNKYGRGKIFNTLCDKYDIKEPIDKLIDVYRNANPDLKLYEDALYILASYSKVKNFLKEDLCLFEGIVESTLYNSKNEEKYNLGIITDGKASVQWNKIKALKISDYVDKIIVTDDRGIDFWKPNEFAYREMMKYFNCKAEECVYVGDNPNKDFIGARKVGMHTIRIIREVGDHMNTFLDKTYEAEFTIKTLYELESIIDKCYNVL